MGFRFRKSFGKGPFRVTVSKSGVGYSVGTKGFRYTKKAGGGTRTTASIPGTGISYVTETSAKKTGKAEPISRIQNEAPPAYASAPQEMPRSSAPISESVTTTRRQKFCPKCQREMELSANRCPHCGKRWDSSSQLSGGQIAAIVIILIIILIAFTGCGTSEPEVPTIDPAILELIEEDDETTETTQLPTIASVEDIFAGQGVAGTGKGEKHNYIYNTSTGVFHEPGCRYVEEMDAAHKAPFTSTREDAIAKGYDPCDHCNP